MLQNDGISMRYVTETYIYIFSDDKSFFLNFLSLMVGCEPTLAVRTTTY